MCLLDICSLQVASILIPVSLELLRIVFSCTLMTSSSFVVGEGKVPLTEVRTFEEVGLTNRPKKVKQRKEKEKKIPGQVQSNEEG